MKYTYVFPTGSPMMAAKELVTAGYEAEKTGDRKVMSDCPPEKLEGIVIGYYSLDGRISEIPASRTGSMADIQDVFRNVYRADCTRIFLEVPDSEWAEPEKAGSD